LGFGTSIKGFFRRLGTNAIREKAANKGKKGVNHGRTIAEKKIILERGREKLGRKSNRMSDGDNLRKSEVNVLCAMEREGEDVEFTGVARRDEDLTGKGGAERFLFC